MKPTYLMLDLQRGERRVPPIGEALRGAREGLGLTIEQAAVDTRISARFLEALEMGRFEDLPAEVYVRGFIRSYATYLRLDPAPLLETFAGAAEPPPPIGEPFGRSGRASPQRPVSGPSGQAPPPTARRERGPGVVPAQDATLFDSPENDPWRGGGAFGTGGVGVLGPGGQRAGAGFAGMIALIGAGVIALGVIVVGLVVLLSGGDDGNQAGGGLPTATATLGPTQAVTVIVVGTQMPTPDPAASPAGTPATAAAGDTPTAEPAAATATPVPSGPTSPPPPTATATDTPMPTETPTQTPTPTPPGPTATPTPLPPGQTDECDRSGATVDCGPAPYFVVCYGPGGFFFDVNGDYPLQPGWERLGPFTTQGAALGAGRACP